jgi:DNA adenine methylase
VDALRTRTSSPIKWVGGKARFREQIVKVFPAHECYVEVFGGAAWVLFAKTPSRVEIFNDLDGELINFFRIVQSEPEELIRSFDFTLTSRAEFSRLCSLDPALLTPIQRAHRFYYVIMASWGGELGRARFQTSVNDGGHGNRLIGALKHLRARILPAYERLQTVIIENLDWRACVERYDRPGVLMYLDPPYPGNNCNYMFNLSSETDHLEIASWMRTAKATVLLSMSDHAVARKIYNGFFDRPVEFSSGMAWRTGRTNKELLISNQPLPG